MPRFYFVKKDKSDITDAVGDVILREKRKRSIISHVKIIGWFIVVLLVVSFILLFSELF